jgi:hypothetical protein
MTTREQRIVQLPPYGAGTLIDKTLKSRIVVLACTTTDLYDF